MEHFLKIPSPLLFFFNSRYTRLTPPASVCIPRQGAIAGFWLAHNTQCKTRSLFRRKGKTPGLFLEAVQTKRQPITMEEAQLTKCKQGLCGNRSDVIFKRPSQEVCSLQFWGEGEQWGWLADVNGFVSSKTQRKRLLVKEASKEPERKHQKKKDNSKYGSR